MADIEALKQLNELVAQQAPGLSRDMLLQATAQSLGNSAHNATLAQNQHNAIIKTNTALASEMLLSMGPKASK
ncbi:hypothetical protein A7985_21770 [Pseudoalteromonas luteoviolacea]|uniref:Glycerol-3-phosphate dehydrogenase n=1 Tax=Pseudoalteromonas luteoviolacea TaxID=43657 RepID=A0A1C0TKK0_9GAMM|nr:RebB family R body protein [Pseudoalteromonas luteoviolacea]MBQ4813144.1 RebB family R body protein [Pseudoalteromonas luteoviolacea]OCQ19079.1 hypothetical protein A7985_21770 [Pseudoalteromonas luteoviolacea]